MTRLLLLLLIPIQLWSHFHDLSVVAIFRDEAPYLKEWIEYHKLVGVTHFYLYNHCSKDDYRAVLAPYLRSGEVDLIEWCEHTANWDQWNTLQCRAYCDGLGRALEVAKWVALIDIDEFIVPVEAGSLTAMLAPYDRPDLGAVSVPVVVFGTSGVDTVLRGRLLIETFTRTEATPNGEYKSIVRPERLLGIRNPHWPMLREGYAIGLLPLEQVQLNHYWARGERYLREVKIPRRLAWGTSRDDVTRWVAGQNCETEYGLPILRFVQPLRRQCNW